VDQGSRLQKLKSLLRQTRRLLAKDNLAADVRVGTERRIKSLETDLAKAELAKKERTLAVRYHKVKFFAFELHREWQYQQEEVDDRGLRDAQQVISDFVGSAGKLISDGSWWEVAKSTVWGNK